MHVSITLNVVYASSTILDKDVLVQNLLNSIESSVSRGMLSPTGIEVIDEYSFGSDDITVTP